MADRATNSSGEVFEWSGTDWVPVAGKPARIEQPRERISSGTAESILVGAGDALSTMGRNARDLAARVTGDQGWQRDIATERAEADRIRAIMQAEAPIASAVGGMLPSLATMPLGMMGGAGMAARLPAAMSAARMGGTAGTMATNLGTAGVLGALGAESGDMGSGAAQDMALAGATGLAGNMVARIREGRKALSAAREASGPIATSLNEAERGIIEGAQAAGMMVTPGQRLNNPQMRRIEAMASSSPVLSPYWDKIKADNQTRLASLAAKAMGVEADNVGPAVLARAEGQLNQQFNEIGQQIGQVSTGKLQKKLDELAAEESTALLPRMELESIARRFARGKQAREFAAPGEADTITGAMLMRERSNIAGEMRDAFAANDSTRGKLFANVLEAIDDTARDAAEKTAKGGPDPAGFDLAARYDRARDQWSVLRSMYRGAATPDGAVKAGRADQIMRKSDASGFVGRAGDDGELLLRTGKVPGDDLGRYYDALRFSTSRLGKDIVGDSGTATRLGSGGFFEGGLLPASGRALRAVSAGPLARAYMNQGGQLEWMQAAQASALAGFNRGQAAGASAGRGLSGGLEE
jgi:hypothetical protein